jgi:hypothetical protein
MKLTKVSWILVVAACGGGGTKAEPTTPEPATVTAPVPVTPVASEHCYAGMRTILLDGKKIGELEVVTRRTLDPATSTIREQTVQGGDAPDRNGVTIKVSGATFTIAEDQGEFIGDGELTAGEPWAWTAWTWRTTVQGMPVTSTDTVDGDRLVSEKTGSAKGMTFVMRDESAAMPCADYEARAEKLAPSNE